VIGRGAEYRRIKNEVVIKVLKVSQTCSCCHQARVSARDIANTAQETWDFKKSLFALQQI